MTLRQDVSFTPRDVAEFLGAIACATEPDLARHEARLAAAVRIHAVDRLTAQQFAAALAARRAVLQVRA